MEGPVQLEFAEFARAASEGAGAGKSRPEGRGAIRGPSRGLCGAAAAGTPPPELKSSGVEKVKSSGGEKPNPFNPSTVQPSNSTAPAAPEPPRPKLVAAIYAEEADEKGNLRLRKVTTSRWLSVRQIADTLHLSVQAVYNRIEFGDLPAHRIGNAIRISSDDFEEYLRRTSTEEDLI